MENRMRIGLFDPGMTYLHRVGLAGLYMTLKYFDEVGQTFPGLSWELSDRHVELFWDEKPKKWLPPLLQESFGCDKAGLIDFAAHRKHPMGDLERIAFSESLRMTFLQHNKQNMIPKGTPDNRQNVSFGEKTVAVRYKPFKGRYAHAVCSGNVLNSKGEFKPTVRIKGWLFPGAAERHGSMAVTSVDERPERALCLIFAPVASLYYRLHHRGLDGKLDKRRGYAVVFPHVVRLSLYNRCYLRYLGAPIKDLSADGLGDASLSALLVLKAQEALDDLGVVGSTAITMGTIAWSSQQRTRTDVETIEKVHQQQLVLFDIARRMMPNRVIIKEQKPTKKTPTPDAGYFVATSQCRGLFADNIANGRDWFLGFSQLMLSKELYRVVSYEKGGLSKMVAQMPWPNEADKKLVEAVHAAIRNRLGAVAAQAKQRGEKMPFDREFERMRTGLMRAKNAETLRAELADLFARGRPNAPLQASWKDLLPVFSGPNWQRTRDLALLALASYKGKEIEDEKQTSEEMED